MDMKQFNNINFDEMNDTEKIMEIKKLFKMYNSGEDENGEIVHFTPIQYCNMIMKIVGEYPEY